MSKKCIIFDLDGTLRNIDHRLHHIKGVHKDYDKFHAEVSKDKPKHDIINLFYMCVAHQIACNFEFDTFIFSGCSESARRDTVKWLETFEVYYERLWMRPIGDHQPDVELKRSWLNKIRKEGYEVIFTVDDRQSVVDMWREEGITCLQCAQWEEDSHDSYIDLSNAHLHVMVGPSGAGKTTWYIKNVLHDLKSNTNVRKITTDGLRLELCGDFRDQSKNDQVFEIYHREIKHHLECGRVVYADSTNLRANDRKKLLKLLPEGVKATYHIIDRPLEDKIRDGGWRKDVYIKKTDKYLMQHHHDMFQSSQKYALEGDGDDRVTVEDHRAF